MIPSDSPMSSDDSRQYLRMLQDIINRMASNSSNCKTWMITIVAALLSIQKSIQAVNPSVWTIIFPVVIFYLLDGYYLAQEKKLRSIESEYVRAIHSENDCSSMIYSFKLTSDTREKVSLLYLKAYLCSVSTLPFYLITCVLLSLFI